MGESSSSDTKLERRTNSRLNRELKSLGNGLEVKEIDWVDVSSQRKEAKESHCRTEDEGEEYDMILAVDCIYNESLLKPLVDTFATYCSGGGKTMVWVVVELRSSDVVSHH